jgi:hypothetical protein
MTWWPQPRFPALRIRQDIVGPFAYGIVGYVQNGNGFGAASFCGLLQGCEVGAAARLRKGDTAKILKPELCAENRRDRRADRCNR